MKKKKIINYLFIVWIGFNVFFVISGQSLIHSSIKERCVDFPNKRIWDKRKYNPDC